ncbi:MAG: prepilin-type N-terminal cleavage/methylation domain-containing protein [Gammaproteobacteria bacterium]|nr:prepilin-type N-terminal cleavage/methylation domain-containing protein [Gammaproteobacteria bacterium]MDH5592554.1 prepilin-type N-terminal cleavage/methylation domain-containing protein [Gammaproteobacteria bacterium]
MKSISKQTGITLIEMMIAMVLGLIVTGSIIAIFVSNVKSTSENVKMLHLNQELRVVMGFISNEIKRAGYSGDPTNTAFMTDFNYDAGNNCIRYSYDADGDGIQDANERFGFRLTANTIQWSSDVTSGTCTNGIWQSLTDTSTASITAFTIVSSDIASGTVTIKQLDVTLIGEIALNPGTASRTITETIRVRNEDAS